MRTRLILAATFIAGLVLVGVGVLLIAIAVGGYDDWDRGQRVLAAALGLFGTALMAGVLALFTRQHILGRPRVTISTIGLSVGSNTIPWAEIVSVGGVRIYGVRLLAIAQPTTAPQRVPRLDSVPFTHLAGLRVLFLAERQLGEDVEIVLQRIRSIREPGAAEPVDDTADGNPWWRSH
jgi:hypothetical protein